jgi:hypothetical protein
MARKLRVQYPGAVYHVLNRGDRREPSFKADADRALLLDILALTEAELKRRRKGDAKKLQVARLLRRETTMRLNWIAKRLKMGAAGSLANLLRREERN